MTDLLWIMDRAIGSACRLDKRPRAAVEKARGAAMAIEVVEGRLVSRCRLGDVVHFDDRFDILGLAH